MGKEARGQTFGTRDGFSVDLDCGMELFTDDVMRGLLAESLDTASVGPSGWYNTGTGPGSSEARHISWLTIPDNAQSVVDDVVRIRNHPLVPTGIPIYGYIFDVKTGKLVEIPEATAAGTAR